MQGTATGMHGGMLTFWSLLPQVSSNTGPFFWEEANAKPSIAHDITQQDRVWNTRELQILHNMAKPVWISNLGLEQDPTRLACSEVSSDCICTVLSDVDGYSSHRATSARASKQTTFQNAACLSLLGKAQDLQEHTALLDAMPEWERTNRLDWADVVSQV